MSKSEEGWQETGIQFQGIQANELSSSRNVLFQTLVRGTVIDRIGKGKVRDFSEPSAVGQLVGFGSRIRG